MEPLVIIIEELELSVSFSNPQKTAVIDELLIGVLRGISDGQSVDELASCAEITTDCVWQIIDEAEAVFDFLLVDRNVLDLTLKGQGLLRAYETVEKKTKEYAEQYFSDLFD